MRVLEINELEKINGEGFIGGLCIGIGTGSVVYGAGVLTNFWNPVGWVSAAFLAADAACLAYGASQL